MAPDWCIETAMLGPSGSSIADFLRHDGSRPARLGSLEFKNSW